MHAHEHDIFTLLRTDLILFRVLVLLEISNQLMLEGIFNQLFAAVFESISVTDKKTQERVPSGSFCPSCC